MPEITLTFMFDRSDLDQDELLEACRGRFTEMEHYLLAGDISHLNTRAEYSNESLELLDIEDLEADNKYSLHYQFGWEAWHGCRDQNDGGIEDEWARFTYKDGIVTFKKLVETRDTIDEF